MESKRYPENFEIEIEREKFIRYKRRSNFMASTLLLGLLGVILCAPVMNLYHYENWRWQTTVFVMAGCIFSGVVAGLLVYVLLGHQSAKREAQGLGLFVEGLYLRLIQKGKHTYFDKKIPFSAIISYACYQDRVMKKCGIMGLLMTTSAGGGINSGIKVPAVKNCSEVRDMLCEIDRARENRPLAQ